MDESEHSSCLLNSADTSQVSDVQLQANKNKGLSKTNKSSKPRITKRAVKKDTNGLQKVPTKRRKYVRSKKETVKVTTSSVEDSVQQLIHQKSNIEASHLLPIVDVMEKYNFKYEVMSESHMKDNFFLQDNYMKLFSNYYPEYICIDFLCEIPELDLNMCLFIGVDANGCCEILSIALIKSLDSGLLWMCEVFKKLNPNWSKVKLIICDKKADSLEFIKIAFPEKMVLFSFFHSLKAFKKDLTNLDHKISAEDTNEAIHIFEQMVFAQDESAYVELLRQIKLMSPSFVTFFKKMWHQKKDSWSLGHLNSKIFFRCLNSYLLSIRKKIRPLVNTQVSIVNVIEKLSFILDILRSKKFQNFASVFNTSSVHAKEIVYKKYSKFLTHYATDLVIEQLEISQNVKIVRKLSCGKYVCETEVIVTTNACSCNFFQLFSLPCCHMFALRKNLSLPLFIELPSSNRWIINNYLDIFMDLQKIFICKVEDCEPQHIEESEKFQKFFKLSAELWPLLVDCPEAVSEDRLKIFKNLLESWRSGIRVNIEISKDDIPSSNNFDSPDDNSFDKWKEMYGVSLKDVLDSDNDFSSISFNSEISNDLI